MNNPKSRAFLWKPEYKNMTKIQQIVNYYFKLKNGMTEEEIKEACKRKEINYARHLRPAKELLELTGSVEKAKEALRIVWNWAESNGLNWAIETIFKKWLELNKIASKGQS